MNGIDTEISERVQAAIQHGVYFTPDPTNPNSIQVRCHRTATEEGHRLADLLRQCRGEVNTFFGAVRPAWPVVDDGLPPLPRSDEGLPPGVWDLHLAAILVEDDMRQIVEDAGHQLLELRADFRERCAHIIREAATAARQAKR